MFTSAITLFTFLILTTIVNSFIITHSHKVYENEYPVVGILSQEWKNLTQYPNYKSYIAASYVKFVESGGARAVPIWIGRDAAYYEDIMSKINGVLFPGGEAWFMVKNGYADAGEHIYKIAKRFNNNGVHFPLWGTCLGFELLTYLSADRKDHRAICNSQAQSVNLEFKRNYDESELFKNAPKDVLNILTTEDVTANFHMFCVTEANLTTFTNNEWKVLSTNRDFNGLEFISTIESKHYPFYGSQFHPEKNMFEWVLNRNISHSRNAVTANSYFSHFFINECAKNDNHFENITTLQEALIYNYCPIYTKGTSVFEQLYLFN